MTLSDQYPEALRRKPEEAGRCPQARSVSRALGDFNELESHSPVLTSGLTPPSHYGESICYDSSQVWTFCRSPSTIRPAAKTLLGNPV